MMTFTQLNLNPKISKALEICGYTKPTPIQTQSIPEILLGKDIVASAQTGTGKTAAFVLPALHRLANNQKPGRTPRVLILTPTRELATQITNAVSKYGKFLQCNIVSLVGGMPYRQQLKGLSRAVDLIVATPGRLLDHMGNKRLDLSGVEMLILDEADRMLDMGFIDDVKNIASAMPKDRQTLLFSATVDDRLNQIIRQFLKNPTRIEIKSAEVAPVKIIQELYIADNPQHKMRLLMHFINNQNIFKAIIFSATKINADRLADELENQGFAAAALHGDLKQNVRTRTLEKLRQGKIQFLIATDVAARGIDIQDITHVINFDLPKFSEDYVHRIGRTGRAGRDGIAMSFALPSDARHVKNIERLLKQSIDRKVVAGLEPKKSLSNSNDSTDRSGHKKRFDSKKDFARKGFADRKARKEFGSRDSFSSDRPKKNFGDRDNFNSDRPKKRFGDRDRFSSDRPKKRFGDRDNFSSDRPKKRFGDRDNFNSDRPKKKFGDRDNFNSDRPKKKFGDRDNFNSDRSKKKFGDRDNFNSDRPKKRFGDRDNFSSDRPKKRFGDRDNFSSDRPKKRFGDRDNFSSDRPKKKFGDRDNFNSDRPKKRFSDKDSFAPRKNKEKPTRRE